MPDPTTSQESVQPAAAAHTELKEYAGGWMTERKGTDAPLFLKIAFPIIGLFCASYMIVYMNGEVNHPERGALVRQFNQATQSSPALMYAIIAMVAVFAVIVVAFAFKAVHKD